MVMKNISIAILLLLNCVIPFSSCNDSEQWDTQEQDLSEQGARLQQLHCKLNSSLDSLWDVTSSQLAHAFPSGFPPVDRDIFLKARNADHMRMFLSFKLLDPAVQEMINNAGKYDDMIAAQVRRLLDEQQAFEHRKIQFLQKVEQKSLEASRIYAGKFRSVSAAACQ